MAAPAPADQCIFAKSIERFRASLSEDQKRDFSIANVKDVTREIQKIQNLLGPERKLRNFAKMRKFLEAMKRVEELVNVFLNVSEVVAFVWGPIKLALQVRVISEFFKSQSVSGFFQCGIAKGKTDTLDLILGTYGEIADVIHGVKEYDRLFQHHEEARRVLEICFDDILRFHQAVLEVFARPAWRTFQTRFRPIIDSLQRHRALLEKEKVTAVLGEVQQLSADMTRRLADLKQSIEMGNLKRKEFVLKQKSALAALLGSPDYEEDQDSAASHRISLSSGDWVLREPALDSWLNSDSPTDATLYLNGGPGCGKTTLVSRIIDHARSRQPALAGPIAFFYFTHQDSWKATVVAMLQAVIVQLLHHDDTVLEYLQQKCARMRDPRTEFRTLSVLQGCLKDCLARQRRAWIILDGLVECENRQIGADGLRSFLKWFQQSILTTGTVLGHQKVRFLASGQRDGRIDELEPLKTCSQTRLERAQSHAADIHTYCRDRAAEIRDRFSLDDEVVLDNLLDQGSLTEFENEMGAGNFPDNLDQAYERVVSRVLEKPPLGKRTAAKAILSWVVCAARPPRWREIQSTFCIKAETGICDCKNRRVDSCKVLCGSLIIYLVHTNRINLMEQYTRVALFCCRYLTSRPLQGSAQYNDVQKSALSGYFGLLDYAVACWQHHVEHLAAETPTLPESDRRSIYNAMRLLLDNYGAEPPKENEDTSKDDSPAGDIQALVHAWRTNPTGTLSALQRTEHVRKVIGYHQGGKQVLVFLLSLPELDKLIVEFMKANVSDTTERLRKLLKFATEKKLEDAVVVIRRYLPDTE
ncbi:hypothetical protein B0H63DRAFT_518180 [Podospora didyma]|uniref:Nephrocystin 3-like N-terminal domain-containing protein n=1 Tax=Podospora didyma TaxID=330526 RepID=A0AAE0P836_9PEZI|nr:hypothetical protein B0H63DRAFT_518180 [Podospora didyma]